MWQFRKNNLIINDQDNFFAHKVHLERLLHAKTHIQSKGPKMPFFLKNKLSTKHLLQTKEYQRCYENAIIFSRLLEIDSSISNYNKIKRPLYCAAFDKKKYNFDKEEKMRNTQRENQKIFIRLIKEKSHYPTQRFLKINNFKNYFRDNIRRQRLDNPNINYATFNEFKENLIKSYTLRRVHSVGDFGKTNKRRNHNYCNIYDTDAIELNNYSPNYGGTSINCLRNINTKNGNNIGYFSTMGYNKNKIGKYLTRCQSAYIRK